MSLLISIDTGTDNTVTMIINPKFWYLMLLHEYLMNWTLKELGLKGQAE